MQEPGATPQDKVELKISLALKERDMPRVISNDGERSLRRVAALENLATSVPWAVGPGCYMSRRWRFKLALER